MKYGNFQDPIGLVARMLKSGNPAAYSSLIREFLSIASGPTDSFLHKRENRILKHDIRGSSLPVILIVGPPRGGTTLVYQALASTLPVSYFNNFSALFPRSPISSSQLFNQVWSHQNTPFDFKNYYGNTRRLSDPNDGFHVWDRWLGKNRYEPKRALSIAEKEDMKAFFQAWLAVFKQPFLNKNNRNLYCMDLLSQCLDNIYFIVVRRDPVFIAQSLFIARQKIQGNQEIGWGLGADQLSSHQGPDAAFRSVAEQVALIYDGLHQQLQKINSKQVIDVQYEEFCLDPNQIVAQIYDAIWSNLEVPKIQPPLIDSFDVSNQVRLSDRSFHKLQGFVQDYSIQAVSTVGL